MVIEIKTDKPYEVIVEDGVLDRAGEKSPRSSVLAAAP